jgi:hypothetical protein
MEDDRLVVTWGAGHSARNSRALEYLMRLRRQKELDPGNSGFFLDKANFLVYDKDTYI